MSEVISVPEVAEPKPVLSSLSAEFDISFDELLKRMPASIRKAMAERFQRADINATNAALLTPAQLETVKKTLNDAGNRYAHKREAARARTARVKEEAKAAAATAKPDESAVDPKAA